MIATQSIGMQPFYYNYKGNRRTIATSVRQLAERGFPMEINYKAIPSFLMYQYSIGGSTLLKDIGVSQPNQIRALQESEPELGEELLPLRLLNLISRSIAKKTEKSQRIGLLLSGGLDSSVVSAVTTTVHRDKVQDAFTATFRGHSELGAATSVAEHLGLTLHEIPVTASMVAGSIEDITALYEEPLGDAALINNYFLCKTASPYVDTVLCGDGGDEIFGGYPWHHYAKYIPWMNWTPLWLRKLAQRLVTGNPTTANRNRLERILLFPAQLSLDSMLLYPTTAMSYQNVEWLLKSDACDYSFVSNSYEDVYDKALAMDCLNTLPGKFMMKANKFSPPAIYSPLIDEDIISFAFGLPQEMRKDKYILRKAVESMLPPKTVWRRKAGFGTPIASWLNSDELQPMVLDKLENGKLLNEICRKWALAEVVDALRAGKVNSTGAAALGLLNVVWGLFSLQVWHDVFPMKTRGKKQEGGSVTCPRNLLTVRLSRPR